MKNCSLPKDTLKLWQIRFSAIAIVVLAAVSFLWFASPWFLLLTGFLLIIFIFLIFWYIPKYLKSYTIKFNNEAIVIRHGIFFINTNIMPFSRMIYIESLTTPLAKTLGLSAVTIKAARGILIVPEMKELDAKDFIDSVSKENV